MSEAFEFLPDAWFPAMAADVIGCTPDEAAQLEADGVIDRTWESVYREAVRRRRPYMAMSMSSRSFMHGELTTDKTCPTCGALMTALRTTPDTGTTYHCVNTCQSSVRPAVMEWVSVGQMKLFDTATIGGGHGPH